MVGFLFQLKFHVISFFVENRVLRLHTTGFADVAFQVCTKVSIFFCLFDVVLVSGMKLTFILRILRNATLGGSVT